MKRSHVIELLALSSLFNGPERKEHAEYILDYLENVVGMLPPIIHGPSGLSVHEWDEEDETK